LQRSGCGISLKGAVADGQYQLDHRNEAWYKDGGLSYITDSLHKGTLTIRTIPTPTSNFSQYHIEGEISFQAIDKNSGKTLMLPMKVFAKKGSILIEIRSFRMIGSLTTAILWENQIFLQV
jgi:hypothetical protein